MPSVLSRHGLYGGMSHHVARLAALAWLPLLSSSGSSCLMTGTISFLKNLYADINLTFPDGLICEDETVMGAEFW